MVPTKDEKALLDLIAKYTFLTDCKDTGNLDIVTYSRFLYQTGEENMKCIKRYMKRLDEHHNDMRAFLDGLKEGN